MKCEYELCVYNNKSTCILDEVQMDSPGMCEACEVVTVPEDILVKYKQKRLEEMRKNT